jgi:hypothetical protein
MSAVSAFRGLPPVLLKNIGDFAGTLKAYQVAMERGSTEIEGKKGRSPGSSRICWWHRSTPLIRRRLVLLR